ncbi:MAG: chromosomal replication initiator protein, partial [Paracoccaceae bacterium]
MPGASEQTAHPIGPAWARIREMTRAEIGGSAFDNWINPLALEDARGTTAVLSTPTNFIGEWVGRHYGDVLTRMISTEFENVTRLEFRLRKRKPSADAGAPEAPAPAPARSPAPVPAAPRPHLMRRTASVAASVVEDLERAEGELTRTSAAAAARAEEEAEAGD